MTEAKFSFSVWREPSMGRKEGSKEAYTLRGSAKWNLYPSWIFKNNVVTSRDRKWNACSIHGKLNLDQHWGECNRPTAVRQWSCKRLVQNGHGCKYSLESIWQWNRPVRAQETHWQGHTILEDYCWEAGWDIWGSDEWYKKGLAWS